MIALDSNIFIYNLTKNPRFVEYSDIIFNGLESGRLKAVTSIISLTEILSYPQTEDTAKQIAEDFLTTPNLLVCDVDSKVAQEAARLRRKNHLRTPDAIQLATALITKARFFVTNDRRLKGFQEVKVQILPEFSEVILKEG